MSNLESISNSIDYNFKKGISFELRKLGSKIVDYNLYKLQNQYRPSLEISIEIKKLILEAFGKNRQINKIKKQLNENKNLHISERVEITKKMENLKREYKDIYNKILKLEKEYQSSLNKEISENQKNILNLSGNDIAKYISLDIISTLSKIILLELGVDKINEMTDLQFNSLNIEQLKSIKDDINIYNNLDSNKKEIIDKNFK